MKREWVLEETPGEVYLYCLTENLPQAIGILAGCGLIIFLPWGNTVAKGVAALTFIIGWYLFLSWCEYNFIVDAATVEYQNHKEREV